MDGDASGVAGRGPFAISVLSEGDLRVLEIEGELDLATAPELQAALGEHGGPGALVCLDLEGCEFIDSTGLQMIVRSAREQLETGGELSVRGLRGEVAEMFRMTALLVEGSPVRLHESGQRTA